MFFMRKSRPIFVRNPRILLGLLYSYSEASVAGKDGSGETRPQTQTVITQVQRGKSVSMPCADWDSLDLYCQRQKKPAVWTIRILSPLQGFSTAVPAGF